MCCLKGLSGGEVVIYPPKTMPASFKTVDNIIVGNVAFYGATSGEAYIAGKAGERFCVRNSGVHAVIESVGDHGCEYMTGGTVVVLGSTGRNFAAGMSGGIAYVVDEDGSFESKLNKEMVSLYELKDCGQTDIDNLRKMIERHVEYTDSKRGRMILENWEDWVAKIRKVMPRDYERMLSAFKRMEEAGCTVQTYKGNEISVKGGGGPTCLTRPLVRTY